MTGSSEGWFSRLKNGLARTRVNIVGLFSGGVIDDDFLEELEYALITADVGVQASTRILQRLRDTIKLKGLKTQDFEMKSPACSRRRSASSTSSRRIPSSS